MRAASLMTLNLLVSSVLWSTFAVAAPCVEQEILYAEVPEQDSVLVTFQDCGDSESGVFLIQDFDGVSGSCHYIAMVRLLGEQLPGSGQTHCVSGVARPLPHAVMANAPSISLCASYAADPNCAGSPGAGSVFYLEPDGVWREDNGDPGLQRDMRSNGVGGVNAADSAVVTVAGTTPLPAQLYLYVESLGAEPTPIVEIWRETNGFPGLQRAPIYSESGGIVAFPDTRYL